jgi:hypothetical protein
VKRKEREERKELDGMPPPPSSSSSDHASLLHSRKL